MEFVCQQCGCELFYADQICPQCGSRYIEVSDAFTVDDRSRINVEKVDPDLYISKSGKHKSYETVTIKRGFSYDYQVPTMEYMREDRLNDQYDKTVTTDDGREICKKHERLSDHRGCGAAKRKKGGGK